jgi:hypothetical protein
MSTDGARGLRYSLVPERGGSGLRGAGQEELPSDLRKEATSSAEMRETESKSSTASAGSPDEKQRRRPSDVK